MKVTFVHLCDYAMLSIDGKPSISGLFQRVTVQAVPSIHVGSYLMFGLELDYTEVGIEHPVRIEVVDQDGVPQKKLRLSVRVPGEGKPGLNPLAYQIVKLPGIPLDRAGRHDINVFVGDPQIATGRAIFDVVVREIESKPLPDPTDNTD